MLVAARGLIFFVLLAFWLWALFDVITTDESRMRNLPKLVWLMIVLFLADIGALAWLLLGRPEGTGWRPGDTTIRPPRTIRGPGTGRQLPPDDDPNFLASLDEKTIEEKRREAIHRYEEEKRRRDEERRRIEEDLLREEPPDDEPPPVA